MILYINDINGIGAQMRAIRKEQKIPLRVLNERTNLSQSTFTKLELGDSKPGIETLVLWAQALGYDEICIFGECETEETEE